jgi:uncharacterized membrane protein YgcG
MGRRRSALLLGILCLAAPLLGQDRSLFWRNLAVKARLDADGRLHVREDQTIVFTGAWNGGERQFRVPLGQELKLDRISRVAPDTGEEHQLVKGNLSNVDEYSWHGNTTLQWRSRRASDPPFDHTAILYHLEYTLSNVLVPRGGEYLLAHDFAFPDRKGEIESFSLDLTLDPVWQAPIGFAPRIERSALRPGESVVVRAALRRSGEGRPRGVLFQAPAAVRLGLSFALVASLLALHLSFFLREKRTGRFEPLPPIDESWIRGNVLRLPPEVVGAAWDEKTGAHEVAAVLARMVGEGKIRSWVERKGFWPFRKSALNMELLADRNSLAGYEKSLVAGLFFAGKTTDTDKVREHYRKIGFDPAGKIRGPVEAVIAKQFRGPRRKRPWKLAAAGTILSVLLLVVAGVLRNEQFLGLAFGLGFGIALLVPAVFGAMVYQNRVTGLGIRAMGFLAPLWIFAAGVAFLTDKSAWPSSSWLLAALCLLCLSFFQIVFGIAAIADDPEKIRFRKGLAAARRYFARQLAQPSPRLEDAWLPYLLAFGLGPRVDRWFHSFGKGVGGTGMAGSVVSASGSTGGGSSSSWTGGGGSFGGGGASGSWGAVQGMAAGISAVSSGSGGSGGGGGSSGGGGGGGW